MKKIFVVSFLALSLLMLSACSNDSGEPVAETPEVVLEEMTAEDVINTLAEAGFPISHVIVYNEETDPNGLLGRPNSYTSKAAAADSRVEQYDVESDPLGVGVEVFETTELAESRKEYIDSFSSGAANMFSEYSYIEGGVLLRIDYDLTPDQAAVYERALRDMADGKKPVFSE